MSRKNTPPPPALSLKIIYASILIICLGLFSFMGVSQEIHFNLEPQQVEVGEPVAITNQSDALEDGHFVFLFGSCSFMQTNLEEPGIVCQVETTDPNAVIEGFFWQAGSFTVTLKAINGEGDTLEPQHALQVEVSPFFAISPSDSCPDSSGFICDNLVCNGSFEWNSASVYYLGQIDFAAPWRELFGSCDLFNENATGVWGPWVGIPDNLFGHQWAHTGNAYMGLGVFLNPNTCEIATSRLKSPLKQGQRYGVEYFTSNAEVFPYSCNGAQVFFSIDEIQASSYQDLLSQINPSYVLDALGSIIITDTVSWVRFYDVFIPVVNDLEWISIGQTRLGIDMLLSYDPSMGDIPGAYYYYDDISVTPLPPLVSLVQDTFYVNACDTVEFWVIGEGAGSYTWSNGDSTEAIQIFPVTDTVYSVTVYDPELCHDTVLYGYVFTKDLNWHTVARITGKNTDCDGKVQSYSLVNGMPGYRYEWSISSNHGWFTASSTQSLIVYNTDPVEIHWNNLPDIPGYALISVAQYNQCEELLGIATFKVFECCFPDVGYFFIDTTITDTIFTSSDEPYIIYGTLTIDAINNVTFDLNPDAKIYMGPEAKIVIKNPNTELILDSCVFLAGCNYMWDGIFLNDSTTRLKASNSSFSDAINTIVADSGAMLEIRDCEFKDNYKSIVIRDFAKSGSPAMPPNAPFWPVEIYGTEFYQTGFPNQKLQYPPYDGVHAQTAIMIQDADTIVVGKPGEAPNHFHDLGQAIIVKNGNGEIINNEFADICAVIDAYPPWGAVDIERKGSSPVLGIETRIGNGTTAGKNSFERCCYPITTYQNPVIIHLNEFLDCSYGVHCLDLRNQTRIVSNSFTQGSTTSLTGETAIILQNVNSSPKLLNVLVDTNYIQGYQKGIWTTNVDKQILGIVRYSYNDIYFNVLSYPVSGIKIDNGAGSLVWENVIRSTTLPSSGFTHGRHNGIWINQTGAALVTHNYMLRMGHGIYTTGQDLLTYFLCNTFDTCFHGFFFGDSTSLSHQGQNGVWNTANNWRGDYSDNNCSYWRRMMQDVGNIQNPVVNWYYPGVMSQYDPGFQQCWLTPPHLLNGFVFPILNNGVSAYCPVYIFLPDAYEASQPSEREGFFGSIVRDENTYGSLQSSYKEAENSLFYSIATARPGMLNMNDTSDFSFQQYFNNLSTSNTGLRHEIYSLIEDGDYAQAYSLNNSIMDTSTWDKTSKQVTRIYLDSWCQGQFVFSQQDRDSLWSIAHASPYERGNAVFSARVLLGIDPDKVPLPYSFSADFLPQVKKAIDFYPNPAKDYICFKLEEDQSGHGAMAEIRLLDILGRPIYQTKHLLIEGENCVPTPKDIFGIYIIRLTSTSGLNESGKIIIRK